MKKWSFTLFSALFVLIASQSFAVTNADLFSLDEAQLEETFSPLKELETAVMAHPEADINFIQQHYASAMTAVNLWDYMSSFGKPRPMADRPVAGISGYIWGACLGLVGIVVVYFLLEDASQQFRKTETTHAVVGCAISAAVWTVLYFTVVSAYWWHW